MSRYELARAVVLVLAGALSSCAWTPAELELKPKMDAAPSDIGKGTTVAYNFVDERDDVTVGHRSIATVGAKITSQQLPAVVDARLREALAARQFTLVAAQQPADANLVYRLRAFKFDIEAGFWTGGRNASAALAVEARRQDKAYNNVYRYNSEERIMFVPGESEINQQMNAALSQILTKAAGDSDLDRFLIGR
jgi:uncharacterized lipoprotein YajG